MMQGVICIGVRTPIAGETIVDKVYRDGNWCVLSCAEYTKRIGLVPWDRHAFVDGAKWQRSGLPRFGKHGASHEYGECEDAEARVA